MEKLSSFNKDDAIKPDDVYITNFIAALELTSTVKTASTIGLSALNKKRSIQVVTSIEEERDKILSKYKTIGVIEIRQRLVRYSKRKK